MKQRKDSIRIVDEILPMVDEEDEVVNLNLVCYIVKDNKDYALCLDPEDEEGILVFSVSQDEDGYDFYEPLEDFDLAEQLFYLYDAHSERYEFGPAT